MLFNSYEFIFAFLPITFFIYFYLNHKRLTQASKGFLVFASLFFYSWWNVAYLPIILSSMLFNFLIGNTLSSTKLSLARHLKQTQASDKSEVPNIASEPRTCSGKSLRSLELVRGFVSSKNKTFSKKSILIFGIIANIALLGYFKYADFFIVNFNIVSGSDASLLNLVLPLAISFFTFQQIAYLVDSYRCETKEYDFLNYALFVTFFPQLIAGPIVHHKEMMPQFANTRNKVKNYRNIALGLFIFSIGLFKKVVIADTFAVWATAGFDTATTLNLFEAWATSLSYTFQLYFDFSGYTDMAIGAALLFNIKLPINFNSPYKATNIQNFWRRWHITLSRFLKEYVYIPLGGNRKGEFRTYNNLLATFIIGGIWHGAGWTFVFWGFLHGVALIIHRAWSKLGFKIWTWLAWLITFNFVNVAWVFFRAKEWDDAVKVLSGMIGVGGITIHPILQTKLNFLTKYGVSFNPYDTIGLPALDILWFFLAFIIVLFLKNSMQTRESFKANKKTALFTGFLLAFGVLSLTKVSEFLYFNF